MRVTTKLPDALSSSSNLVLQVTIKKTRGAAGEKIVKDAEMHSMNP